MKPELRDALYRDFPKLYADVRCGFYAPDGWEPIIRKLSAILEPLGVQADQVKEKFGGLRFYISPLDDSLIDDANLSDTIYRAIQDAEDEAWKTCGACGRPGKPVAVGGCVQTNCEDCLRIRRG